MLTKPVPFRTLASARIAGCGAQSGKSSCARLSRPPAQLLLHAAQGRGSDGGSRVSASLQRRATYGPLALLVPAGKGLTKSSELAGPVPKGQRPPACVHHARLPPPFQGSSTFVDLRRALHAEDPPLLVRGQIRSVHEACSLSHLSFASRTYQQLLGDLKRKRCGTHDNTSQRTGQMMLAWCYTSGS